MNTINERVQIIADKYYKGNVTAFSKSVGVTQSTIRDIVKGRMNQPSNETIQKILNVDALKYINPGWLLTGNGPMLRKGEAKTDFEPESISNSTGVGAPYYPDINASAGLNFLTENGNSYSVPISIPNVDAQAFINVFGDSMYPKYCSGEIIGIKEVQKDMVFPGHAFVIQLTDGEAYIKYIDPGKDDDHWILRSENPHYKPKQLHLSKIYKVYIIKAIITKSTLL